MDSTIFFGRDLGSEGSLIVSQLTTALELHYGKDEIAKLVHSLAEFLHTDVTSIYIQLSLISQIGLAEA